MFKKLVSIQKTINCRGRLLSLQKPVVMGILNLTPDSFSDGGQYTDPETALKYAGQMLADGAQIIDIGGYSSRPNAADVSPDVELERIYETTSRIIKQHPQAIISIDTFRASVADEMLKLGAHIINDISGGELDEQMFETVARYRAPYILMHMKGTPQTMQQETDYADVMEDIWQYFVTRINLAREKGVKDIIIDPGFGFAKTLKQNYEVFNNLYQFHTFRLPMMIGVSRKSMVTKLLDCDTEGSLPATTALHLKALEMGVSILRVHDVKAAARVIHLHSYLNSETI